MAEVIALSEVDDRTDKYLEQTLEVPMRYDELTAQHPAKRVSHTTLPVCMSTRPNGLTYRGSVPNMDLVKSSTIKQSR